MAPMALLRPAPPLGGGVSTPARATIDTPIGVLTLVASPAALREVWFPNRGQVVDDPDDQHPILAEVAVQLGEYFDGTRQDFDIPLEPQGTPFQLTAWHGLCHDPVRPDRQLRRAGRPDRAAGKARAIGAANGQQPAADHRAVPPRRRRNGRWSASAVGSRRRRWLLHHERQVLGLELPL